MRVFKIVPTSDYKKMMEDNKDNTIINNADNFHTTKIIDIEVHSTHIIKYPSTEKKDEERGVYVVDPYELDCDRESIFVDNKGNAILYLPPREVFQINEKNLWRQYMSMLDDHDFLLDKIDILKFGQNVFVIKHFEDILKVRYKGAKIKSSKMLKHKAVDIVEQCDLEQIIIPRNPKYLIFVYDLNGASTIITWDTQK